MSTATNNNASLLIKDVTIDLLVDALLIRATQPPSERYRYITFMQQLADNLKQLCMLHSINSNTTQKFSNVVTQLSTHNVHINVAVLLILDAASTLVPHLFNEDITLSPHTYKAKPNTHSLVQHHCDSHVFSLHPSSTIQELDDILDTKKHMTHFKLQDFMVNLATESILQAKHRGKSFERYFQTHQKATKHYFTKLNDGWRDLLLEDGSGQEIVALILHIGHPDPREVFDVFQQWGQQGFDFFFHSNLVSLAEKKPQQMDEAAIKQYFQDLFDHKSKEFERLDKKWGTISLSQTLQHLRQRPLMPLFQVKNGDCTSWIRYGCT